jgi:hypothetical protein
MVNDSVSLPDVVILATLPTPIANDLIAKGFAHTVPRVRAGELMDVDLWIAFSQVAATVVTIVQTPSTVDQLIELVARTRRNRSASSGRIMLKARGSRGRIELSVDADTAGDDIVRVLRLLA